MRRKAELYGPIIATMAVTTVAIAAITLFFDKYLFYITASLAVLSLLFALFRLWNSEQEIDRFVVRLARAVDSMQTDTLLKFPLPVVVSNTEGEIVWYNELCGEKLFGGKELYGSPITRIVPDYDPERAQSEPYQLAYQERRYTAFAVQSSCTTELITAFYLIDDTDLKHWTDEYFDTRPSVLILMIDSFDELLQNAKENERSQLLSQIEYYIEKFVGENNGVVVKTDRDKFVAIIEERYMKGIVEKRFEILDSVRTLMGADRLPVTLSIGVSRNAQSYAQGEEGARQALDMSLGRGGDQAAVKTQSGYDFYGGLSKGIEKRTKVKTRIVATALMELIEASSNVIMMGHKFADLDAFGAAVGLMKSVRQMGKPAVVAINRTQNLVQSFVERLEENGYENSFLDPGEALERVTPQTLLIVVDTHIQHMVESAEIYKNCKTVVVIDHHRRMVGYIENAVIFYHEPYASSASEMVTELVQYFGERNRISRLEAEALLAGIMLDTKNFVIKTGVRTFEAAAYLRRQGADTVEVRKMFSSSMEHYQRRSQVVSSAEVYRGCAIALANPGMDDIKLVAPQAADELLNISGVDASFVLYEYDGGVSFSARSMGNLNVQIIMEKLGGGGHLTMAGAQVSDITLEDARQRLLQSIDAYLQEKQS